VTGVQTCALPIFGKAGARAVASGDMADGQKRHQVVLKAFSGIGKTHRGMKGRSFFFGSVRACNQEVR